MINIAKGGKIKKRKPWHVRFRSYLTEPRSPKEILEHFKKENLVRPVMYKVLNRMREWEEVQKLPIGRFVSTSYEPLEKIIILAQNKLRKFSPTLKELPIDRSYITNETLLKETASLIGVDPRDEEFRKRYWKAVKWIQEHPKIKKFKAEDYYLGKQAPSEI